MDEQQKNIANATLQATLLAARGISIMALFFLIPLTIVVFVISSVWLFFVYLMIGAHATLLLLSVIAFLSWLLFFRK